MEELKNGRGLSLQGVFELGADGLADFVGQAVFQFGEDALVDDGPHQLVVEVALSLSAPSLALAVPAVLDVEEAQMQGYEVVDGIASLGNLGDGCRVVGKGLQLSRAPLEGADGWPPCVLQLLHALLHRLVDELLTNKRICYHAFSLEGMKPVVSKLSWTPQIASAILPTIAPNVSASAPRLTARRTASSKPLL